MKSSDEDRCPVAPPPRSCLLSQPIRSRRVTFSQDSRLCKEEEGDPGGCQTSLPLLSESCRRLSLTSDQKDVQQRSQEVAVSVARRLNDGRGHTWSGSCSLQSDRTSPHGVGVSEMSVVLGGLLKLVEQHWNGPGSLLRHQQFLGGAYNLLSELLQPAGAGDVRDEVGLGFRRSSELVLLKRRLERTEQLLERMKRKLVSTLKENYRLKRIRVSEEAAADLRTARHTHDDTRHSSL